MCFGKQFPVARVYLFWAIMLVASCLWSGWTITEAQDEGLDLVKLLLLPVIYS